MTSAIEIREVPEQRLLVKKITCSQSAIGPAFQQAIHAVGECIRSSEAKMISMPYAVYLAWRAHDCDLAAGCQVSGTVTLTGGCEWLTLPAGAHAFASHFGPYDQLKETHAAIMAWCQTNGKTMTGACWETYPVDPGLEPDPSKWQTDVYYPVA
jgi:effector-binding domain-containing protein